MSDDGAGSRSLPPVRWRRQSPSASRPLCEHFVKAGSGRTAAPSPSAETRGHGGEKPPPLTGKEHVKIARLEPVGNYAVRIVFDDGHDSGLYSWAYLYKLGSDMDRIWADYQKACGV